MLFLPGSVFAADNDEFQRYQKKLERVQQSINKVKQHLKSTRYKRGHVVTDLKQLEGEISKNSAALGETEAKIDGLSSKISDLRGELSGLQEKLDKQRQRLSAQLRAAYAIGRQQQVKMFLNQQDPAEMGRVMVYFDYLNRAREQQIREFLHSIEEKRRVEAELQTALDDQQDAMDTRRKQKKSLLSQRLKRNELLARLERQISNQEQNLTELEGSRNRIEDLLMSLGELLADIPQSPSDSRPFKKQKGKLPWPASGPFLASYGEARKQGGLKWNGVLISTKHGTPVRAISRGRVAFADWLQGFGFITIIDHGDGYMSLYGHNETLVKQAGEWVNASEVIATSGDSGGQPMPGVYFEIRSRGKPVNPSQWCSRRNKHVAELK
ncbi:MAG: peptidoglycan DD-metalloendopeptidase family protein [Thiotrichales bacterium]|nr:MAG: peptidoglycan DD-metalloendopeptidase family protein [Thiotrichales bacterium]